MNKQEKKTHLREKLQFWEALNRLSKMEEYKDYLRPRLQEAFNNRWIDPNQVDENGQPLFDTYEAFHKAYTEMRGKAVAYQEITNMIDGASAMVEQISKAIEDPSADYGLGLNQREE